MDKKSIDCMTQHIKIFHAQSLKEQVADFVEPCQMCLHKECCNFDWISIMKPLLDKSCVEISMVHLGQTDKQDSDGICLGRGKNIHQ